MLILFETPAGYALFKASDKLSSASSGDVWKYFSSADKASSAVKLKAFQKFDDTTSALSAATAICDGKLDKSLKSFLSSNVGKKDSSVQLGVVDSKLGGLIKEKLNLQCVYDNTVLEVIRGIRSQMDSLISGLSSADNNQMKLGLSHSLCRYKLKFSPDKVDTMIIQAISLLDELDKELNTYAMRVREWYGWHFPEMGRIVTDNIMYAKVVRKMGVRSSAHTIDFSDILAEEIEVPLKEAAEVSMGTEIADEDVQNIKQLCEQVISISEYRASLYEYLRNRMNAIAPNLTVMVGELVGARLIAHAGSLMSLAKHPASTVQILGAEKALFRALKTKHDTPKYGLIYHASLVGQAAPKLKGKVSRMLAAKTALSIRMDALGDADGVTIGYEAKEKVEQRLKQMEGGQITQLSQKKNNKPQQEKYVKPNNTKSYNSSSDITNMDISVEESKDNSTQIKKEKKDKKKEKSESNNGAHIQNTTEESEEEKKKRKKEEKKKRKLEESATVESNNKSSSKSSDNGDEAEKSKKKKDKKSKKQKTESSD